MLQWKVYVALPGRIVHSLVDSCLAAIATLAWEVFTVVRYTCVRRLEM